MKKYMELNEMEKIYKKLFHQNSSVYDVPIMNWEDFRKKYIQSCKESVDVPLTSPTYIEEWLGEEIFFRTLEEEVCLLRNARYCPPFWHRLKFIKIVYVYSGSCVFYMDDKKIEMEKGSFCIVGPNVKQAVASFDDDDSVINLITRYSTFSESFFSLLMEQGAVSDFLWNMLYNQNENIALLYSGEVNLILQELVEEMYQENILGEEKSNLIMKSMLMLFFGEIFREHKNTLRILGNVKEKKVHYLPQILCYMRDHISTATLPDLAAYMQLSEGYISRYIKKKTGHTFRDLLRDMRMSKAEKMLMNTDFSIDKILETVGYTDKSRFYRNFIVRVGMAPGKYRKQHTLYRI